MSGKGSEYTKHTEGKATVFDVTPAAAPKFIFVLVIAVFFAVFGLATLKSEFGWVLLVIAALFAWLGWRDMRPKPHRGPSTFRVTADAIEAKGQTFPKDDIHRLLLRNGVTDQELLDTYASSTGQKAGVAQRARMARVANGLTVEAGGKSTLLAGGLDETTAYGLLHETCQVLGFDIK